MARAPAASVGWLASAVRHCERGRLGYLRRDLGVLLLMAGLQRGDLLAELRIIGIGDVDGHELLQVRDAPQLLAHMRREFQVRPVAVEGLEHIHRAVLELPAELGGPRRTTSPRGWPRTGEASPRPPGAAPRSDRPCTSPG